MYFFGRRYLFIVGSCHDFFLRLILRNIFVAFGSLSIATEKFFSSLLWTWNKEHEHDFSRLKYISKLLSKKKNYYYIFLTYSFSFQKTPNSVALYISWRHIVLIQLRHISQGSFPRDSVAAAWWFLIQLRWSYGYNTKEASFFSLKVATLVVVI